MESICKARIITELFGPDALWNDVDLTDRHYYQELPSAPVDITLPYRAEGNFEPPLPTPKDIANARTTPLGPNIPKSTYVYKVFDTYVVKFSRSETILQVHIYLSIKGCNILTRVGGGEFTLPGEELPSPNAQGLRCLHPSR